MADTNTELVAAISAGAVLVSQILNLLFNSYNETRKQNFELSRTFTQNKIQVGEDFFVMSGTYVAYLNDLIFLVENGTLLDDKETKDIIVEDFMDKDKRFKEFSLGTSNYAKVELYYNIIRGHQSVPEESAEITKQIVDGLAIQKKYILSLTTSHPLQRDSVIKHYKKLCDDIRNVVELVKKDMEIVKKEIVRISFKN